MLWIKSFHIIFMVTWFAGLFYLPRLFVYHSMAVDKISIDRFIIMERKLLYGIMTPGGILTIAFGFWLMFQYKTWPRPPRVALNMTSTKFKGRFLLPRQNRFRDMCLFSWYQFRSTRNCAS